MSKKSMSDIEMLAIGGLAIFLLFSKAPAATVTNLSQTTPALPANTDSGGDNFGIVDSAGWD